jgi:hypothetical protein
MAVGGPEELYGNSDVFTTHRVSRDRRRYATQNDLVKHNRTETWYHDRSYTWAEIRDLHARCYPFPRGFYMFGHPHRCNLPFFTINGGAVLPQFRSLKQIGSVRAAQGTPGSLLNRTYFTTMGISAFTIPATHKDDWRIVFLSGDFQGIEREIASYQGVMERLRLTGTVGGQKEGKPLPCWDKRAIRDGDAFKIFCRHNDTTASRVTTFWETTSRIFRYPFGSNPYNVYKSIRFKYSTVLAPQVNTIGDDPTGVENWSIADGDRLSLTWREITYNFTPELAPVYPSDLFPGCGAKTHRLWPSEQHLGAIVSVTPVFIGNYTPPGRIGAYAVPVYVYDIRYTGTGPLGKRYEWPVFYRVKGGMAGFVPELWSQGRTKKCAPRPKRRACHGRKGGWYFNLNGDWIHCDYAQGGLPSAFLGQPVWERNSIQYHADAYVRLRNMKDGGLTPLSRMKIGVKYRRISGYGWNIPVLEG